MSKMKHRSTVDRAFLRVESAEMSAESVPAVPSTERRIAASPRAAAPRKNGTRSAGTRT